MRTLLNLLLLAVLLPSCITQQLISYNVHTEPRHILEPKPEKLVVLNTYDPSSSNRRKNVEEVSAELINTTMQGIAEVINRRTGVPTEAVPGFTPLPLHNNPVSFLLEKHHATHAILITYFDIQFDQRGVEVTKTAEGKSREAYYDICNTINFELHDRTTLLDKSSHPVCRPHSSRPVISGLLAAGPSYQNNKNDFQQLSLQNTQAFLRQHFPAEARITRPLFVGGIFSTVGQAVSRNDYETAMTECRNIATSEKPRVAARALYNCAVLSERNNDYKAVRQYLDESLARVRLPQAELMISEIGDFTNE